MAKIKVNMPKARKIHLKNLRAKRDAKLDESDKDMQRASDNNNNAEVARLKQLRKKLRDMPTDVAAALQAVTTPEQLKAVTIPELE